MLIKKISIIGNGFVGNAIYQNFKEHSQCLVYDIDANKSLNTLQECLECDLIFICLPTPMRSPEGGECNLTILQDFFEKIPKNVKGIFIIKSTIPIGTTKKLKQNRPDLKIIHNPEFLTAANAINDFKNAERNIFGGDKQTCEAIIDFFKIIFPNTKNIIVDSSESEAIKYFSNVFLALKVAYFNKIFDLAQKQNLNFANLIEGITSDTRIGLSHTRVPGPDGDRGFGGTCFPKDINALIKTFEENNLNSNLLKEVWEYNKTIRKEWDWANNKSAVCDKD